MPEIVFTLSEDGSVSAEGMNFPGTQCDAKINEYIKAMGGKIRSEKRKPAQQKAVVKVSSKASL